MLSKPQTNGAVYERDACPLRCCLSAVAYRYGASCQVCSLGVCCSCRLAPPLPAPLRLRAVSSRDQRRRESLRAQGALICRCWRRQWPQRHAVACWRGPLSRGVLMCTTHALHEKLTVALPMTRSACVSLAPLSFCCFVAYHLWPAFAAQHLRVRHWRRCMRQLNAACADEVVQAERSAVGRVGPPKTLGNELVRSYGREPENVW